jgi:uncharacterized protein YndB with AHSA1/START domain
VTETITIAATAEKVYDLIADVARMGEYSPEATGAFRAGPQLGEGDRFVGANKRGPVRWWTQCTVLRAQRGRVFEFDVDFGPVPVSRWTYEFVPADDGATQVTEAWVDRRDGLLALPVRLVGQLLIPGDRGKHNQANMRVTLERVKAAAEG